MGGEQPVGKSRAPFTLTEPCAHCPFRCDRTPYLREDRAEEIAASITGGDWFPCHQTVDYYDPDDDNPDDLGVSTGWRARVCAGALIVLEREGADPQFTQIGERLGLYVREALNMSAPVFSSMAEWARAHRGR